MRKYHSPSLLDPSDLIGAAATAGVGAVGGAGGGASSSIKG